MGGYPEPLTLAMQRTEEIRDCFVSRVRECLFQSLFIENHIPSYTLLCFSTLASIFLKQYETVHIDALSRGAL